jgi:putative endonuclease
MRGVNPSRAKMSLLARLMYRSLVWKERQRARAASRLARPSDPRGSTAAHLDTGRRGETLAYWYLRQAGYTIVARNRPGRAGAGEVDLVGWDGPVLAFIEVKTRASDQAGPPEAAVSRQQRQRIARAAKRYLQQLGRKAVPYRFDIASVSWDEKAGYQVRLLKDAFKG